jgi:hypothetical protein
MYICVTGVNCSTGKGHLAFMRLQMVGSAGEQDMPGAIDP